MNDRNIEAQKMQFSFGFGVCLCSLFRVISQLFTFYIVVFVSVASSLFFLHLSSFLKLKKAQTSYTNAKHTHITKEEKRNEKEIVDKRKQFVVAFFTSG